MFRLYGNIEGWKLLKTDIDEIKIIKELGKYITEYKEINYLIIKHENNQDIPYMVIINEQQYYDYVNSVAKIKRK